METPGQKRGAGEWPGPHRQVSNGRLAEMDMALVHCPLAAGLAKSTQDTAEFGATKADLTLEGGVHSQSKLPAPPVPQTGP